MKIDHGITLNKELDKPPATSSVSAGCAWDSLNKILNAINHSLIAIVTFVVCWKAFTNATVSFFEMHIAFCVLGYQFLMSETILTLSRENSWTASMDRCVKKAFHCTLATLSTVFVTVGTAFVIYYRSKHFTSPHGILGLAAFVLLIISVINGPMTLFSGLMNKRVKPVYLRIYHTITTSGCFCVGMAALCTGYNKRWFISRTSQELATCFTVFSCITIFLTMKVPLINTYKLFRGMCQRN